MSTYSLPKLTICAEHLNLLSQNNVAFMSNEGNGGLQSYNGYANSNYGGQRNLGFGYYRGTDSYGFLPSREVNYYSGTGYRGYN